MAIFTDDIDPFGDGSLVAGFNLDGDATDYVGTKDGTPASMTYASSPLGQEGVFDGTNSEIDIDAYSETLVSSTLPFSISFFVTLNELKGQNLISFGGATNGCTICQYNGLTLGFAGNNAGVNTQFASGITLSLSTRYHIVLARIGTGTTYNMYLDKVLVGSAVSVPFSDGSDPDRLGGNTAEMFDTTGVTTGASLNGKLDQVMFFNREVTQSEVDLLNEIQAEGTVYSNSFNSDMDGLSTFDGARGSIAYNTGYVDVLNSGTGNMYVTVDIGLTVPAGSIISFVMNTSGYTVDSEAVVYEAVGGVAGISHVSGSTSLNTDFEFTTVADADSFIFRAGEEFEDWVLDELVIKLVTSSGLEITFNAVVTTQVFFNGVELTEAHMNGTQLQ